MISTYNSIKRLIEKYGLKPALKRDLSLFASSCLGLSYTTLLEKYFGINYNAYAAISRQGDYLSFINTPFIAKKAAKILEREDYLWGKIVPKVEKIFSDTLKEMQEYVPDKDISVKKKLEKIVNIMPVHYIAVGLVNAFMRYFDDKSAAKKHSKEFIVKIGNLRNKLASQYLWFDSVFLKYAKQYEKEMDIPNNTLRYLIIPELKEALRNKKLLNEFAKASKSRQKAYFHYFIPSPQKEGVITDVKIIKNIIDYYTKGEKTDEKFLKGTAAFKGLAKGIIYILSKNNPPKDFILVTHMTHPKDIALMKKAKAIITDEGGILSHAAIVSRELKIPCIIGTKIATKVLKDGDLVEVNADKEVVKIIKRLK
jgi:phosphohistidine swiveling domain-containing protein